jgi:hypothetical protein
MPPQESSYAHEVSGSRSKLALDLGKAHQSRLAIVPDLSQPLCHKVSVLQVRFRIDSFIICQQ